MTTSNQITDVEIFKASALALGLPIATATSWARYEKSADECWIHKDECFDGSLYQWNPFLNADQRWECVRKLLEVCVTVTFGKHDAAFYAESVGVWASHCLAEEFPARALAELHRRI